MSEEQIREHGRSRGFHPRTVERWLAWREPDREALLQLALGLRIGENHLRDLMDWLEEIALRDQTSVATILGGSQLRDLNSHPRLGRADKLKRIKEEIRRRRFPRLSRIEDAVQARIRELKLHPAVDVSVAAGLEGGDLRVEFRARSEGEIKTAVTRLAEACSKQSMREIFELLRGEKSME